MSKKSPKSAEINLHRVSILFHDGIAEKALQDAVSHLEDDVEFDFEAFDSEFDRLIDLDEWDEKDSMRLCALFFARSVVSRLEREAYGEKEDD